MAFKGFNDDTLAALAAQAGKNDKTEVTAPATETKPEDKLPDITMVDIKDDKTGEEAETAAKAEAEKAAKELAEKDAKTKEEEEAAKAKADEDAKEAADLKSDEVVNTLLKDANFDIKDVSARIIKDGGITDELKAELKEKLDPGLVDAYVESFEKQLADAKPKEEPKKDQSAEQAAKDKAQIDMNKFIYDSVGGKDTFVILAEALSANGDKETIGKINAKIASTNKALVKEGLEDAVSAYNKLTGRGNNRMSGEPNGDTEQNKFEFITKNEYQTAINSEKYKTDPIYAKKMDDDRMKSIQLDKQQTMPGQFRNIRDGKMYNL